VQLESAWTAVNGTIINSDDNDPNGYNYKNNQTAIVPRPLNLSSPSCPENSVWKWDVPPYSITVLQFDLA